MRKAAVLLDRDGVLNVDREDFVQHVEALELLPGVAEAVARLNRAGLPVVVVSNQSGIGQGLFTWEALQEVTQALQREIEKAGGTLPHFYYCPHTARDGCECRKPRPGLLLQAAQELGIDLTRSYLVGDGQRDIQAAKAVGCTAILVLSGATTPDMLNLIEPPPDHIAPDLPAAVEWILGRFGVSHSNV